MPERLISMEAALAGYPNPAFRDRLRKDLERKVGMTMTSGIRPGFTSVTPYVRVQDVERLIEFIKQVFGAEETERSKGSGGRIHCEMRIGDSMVMAGGGREVKPRLAGFHIYVEDADAVYQRALEAGAESLGEPEDRPYGERAGFVKDPAGNHWYIATHQGPSYRPEGLRTVTPHLILERATEFIDFLKAGFGARLEARHDSPEGTLMHGVVRIEGAAIELGEMPGFVMPAGFYLYVKDCDALYKQAIKAGAKSLYPPMDQPYGDRMGGVEDAWGNEWFISTHLARESR